MNKTKIPWCDYTINPVKGLCPMHCKTPGGYEYCYAAGERGLYKRFKWNPEIRFDELWIPDLANIKKPSRIFVGSTMELFGDWVKYWWLKTVFDFAILYPQHTFIFLTKKPENLIKWSPFPDNCWVGVSATNADMYWDAWHGLKEVEAKVKFISIEPFLNGIAQPVIGIIRGGINWLIIGSQTQPVKHPPREWVDEIIEATDRGRIPLFVKEPMAGYYGINRQEFPDCR